MMEQETFQTGKCVTFYVFVCVSVMCSVWFGGFCFEWRVDGKMNHKWLSRSHENTTGKITVEGKPVSPRWWGTEAGERRRCSHGDSSSRPRAVPVWWQSQGNMAQQQDTTTTNSQQQQNTTLVPGEKMTEWTNGLGLHLTFQKEPSLFKSSFT